jgi:DNA (cytosine-5)-methyltransferase 1
MLSRQFGASVGSAANEPAPTVMPGGGGKTAVVTAHLSAYYGNGAGSVDRSAPADEPTRTVPTENRHAVVAAFLAQNNYMEPGHDTREPVSTIVAKGSTQSVVSAGLVNMKGSDRRGPSAEDPAPTQTAQGWHIAEVQALLVKYYGAEQQDPDLREALHTITSKARFGLCTVMIGGEPWMIVDIGMRMLTPRELYRAQGFPDTYIIDRVRMLMKGADGIYVPADEWVPVTKTDQIRMCGNSVCPQVSEALVRANYAPRIEDTEPEPFRMVAAE